MLRYTGDCAIGASWAAMSLEELALPMTRTRCRKVNMERFVAKFFAYLALIASWPSPPLCVNGKVLLFEFLDPLSLRPDYVVVPSDCHYNGVPDLFARLAIGVPVIESDLPATFGQLLNSSDLCVQSNLTVLQVWLRERAKILISLCEGRKWLMRRGRRFGEGMVGEGEIFGKDVADKPRI